MPNPDEERDTAIRNVLHGWGDLSRGDVSVICAVLRERGGTILTSAGSAHACFWQNMIALGYAELDYSPIDPVDEVVETLAFRPTHKGLHNLPSFLIHYDLLNSGSCAPASVAIEVPPTGSQSLTSWRIQYVIVPMLFVFSAL